MTGADIFAGLSLLIAITSLGFPARFGNGTLLFLTIIMNCGGMGRKRHVRTSSHPSCGRVCDRYRSERGCVLVGCFTVVGSDPEA